MTEETNSTERTSDRSIAEALLGYSFLCLLSIGSRFYSPLWLGVMLFGFAYPTIWSRLTRIKLPETTCKKGIIASVGWGTLTGVIFSAYCVVSPGAWDQFPPTFPVLQMTIGSFAFAAVLSPFQELFFRAWLQPRLERVGGSFNSVVMTSLLFMFWHWLPPFSESGDVSLNIVSLWGSVSTFLLGMVCGVAYWKTRRLLAPWIAHTIAGATITALGKVSILQMIE